MRGFGERLRRRAKQLGMSDAEVARRAGLSARRYGNYVSNDREPDLSTLLTISQVLDSTPNWLLGLTDDEDSTSSLPARKGGDIVTYSGEDYAAIPSYDVEAAAGYGAIVDGEEIKDRLLFKLQWLRSVTSADLDDLAVIRIDGDSMEPTLRSGDSALIDRTQRFPGRKDGLYALRSDGGLQVKRVSAHPQTRMFTITSDNPAYPTYTNINPEAIDVIGRVIWIGRRV